MARPRRRTFREALDYCDEHPCYAVRDKSRNRYKRFGKHIYKLKWGQRLWKRWRARNKQSLLADCHGPFKLSEIQIPFYLLIKILPRFPVSKGHFSQRFRRSNVRVANHYGDIVITSRKMSITLKEGVEVDEAIEEAKYMLDLIRRKSFGFNFYPKKNP